MLIFKVELTLTDEDGNLRKSCEDREERKNYVTELIVDFNDKLPEGINLYLARKGKEDATMYAVVEMSSLLSSVEDYVRDLMYRLKWEGEIVSMKEATISAFGRSIRTCSYVDDSGEVLSRYGIEDISMSLSRHGKEILISNSMDREKRISLP